MNHWHLPSNYRFAGVKAGIRADATRPDLALLVSDVPAAAAGVFTQNRVFAAPVRLCRERVPLADARGVVICAGNANACTGQRGYDDAVRMAELAAAGVGCRPGQMLVCSTGVIGVHLPMDRVEKGIAAAAAEIAPTREAFELAARSILTTDTRIKVSTRSLHLSGGPVAVTGFAKGAAMIGPNMATMLAFVLTDAAVAPAALADLARRAADGSFNSISVEGHTSTNDTLLLFANGQGAPLSGSDREQFEAAVMSVCADLAQQIIGDAEGATHVICIKVSGLRTEAEARRVAKSVADSALVKTAIFGADPNWGRIVSAAGYSGVEFEERQLSLLLGETLLYKDGVPQKFDAAAASKYIKDNREVVLQLMFSIGTAGCTFWTCDLTYDYVKLNAEYTT